MLGCKLRKNRELGLNHANDPDVDSNDDDDDNDNDDDEEDRFAKCWKFLRLRFSVLEKKVKIGRVSQVPYEIWQLRVR